MHPVMKGLAMQAYRYTPTSETNNFTADVHERFNSKFSL